MYEVWWTPSAWPASLHQRVVKATQKAFNDFELGGWSATIDFRYPRGKPRTFFRISFTDINISYCHHFEYSKNNYKQQQVEYRDFTNWYAVPKYKLWIQLKIFLYQAELMQKADQLSISLGNHTLFFESVDGQNKMEITAR